MRACIIANSPSFEQQTALRLARRADLVIVADGAIAQVPRDLVPHIVCGDMDSHQPDAHTSRFPTTEWVHRPCQESNDLEKAITIAKERGASHIDLVCAFGGRVDQTLMTLSVMELFHKDLPITLHHDGWEVQLCGGSGATVGMCELDVRSDAIISLVVRSQVATVSISNVRWPLSKELLKPGSRGLSNRSLGDIVTTTVHEGCVAVCWRTEDRAGADSGLVG
jgi:thiamine pyrophosphokinase